MSKKKPSKRAVAGNDLSEQVHDSSGNVFADLGFSDAGERLTKAQACSHDLVSALMRGKLRDFSTERLMRFVTALDHAVPFAVAATPADQNELDFALHQCAKQSTEVRHHRGGSL